MEAPVHSPPGPICATSDPVKELLRHIDGGGRIPRVARLSVSRFLVLQKKEPSRSRTDDPAPPRVSTGIFSQASTRALLTTNKHVAKTDDRQVFRKDESEANRRVARALDMAEECIERMKGEEKWPAKMRILFPWNIMVTRKILRVWLCMNIRRLTGERLFRKFGRSLKSTFFPDVNVTREAIALTNRQQGKSIAAAIQRFVMMMGAHSDTPDSPINLANFAPTRDQAKETMKNLFAKVLPHFARETKECLKECVNNEGLYEVYNRATNTRVKIYIRGMTDTIRGLSIDDLYIDEMGNLENWDMFELVVKPMSAVEGRTCFITSTPSREGTPFYDYIKRTETRQHSLAKRGIDIQLLFKLGMVCDECDAHGTLVSCRHRWHYTTPWKLQSYFVKAFEDYRHEEWKLAQEILGVPVPQSQPCFPRPVVEENLRARLSWKECQPDNGYLYVAVDPKGMGKDYFGVVAGIYVKNVMTILGLSYQQLPNNSLDKMGKCVESLVRGVMMNHSLLFQSGPVLLCPIIEGQGTQGPIAHAIYHHLNSIFPDSVMPLHSGEKFQNNPCVLMTDQLKTKALMYMSKAFRNHRVQVSDNAWGDPPGQDLVEELVDQACAYNYDSQKGKTSGKRKNEKKSDDLFSAFLLLVRESVDHINGGEWLSIEEELLAKEFGKRKRKREAFDFADRSAKVRG